MNYRAEQLADARCHEDLYFENEVGIVACRIEYWTGGYYPVKKGGVRRCMRGMVGGDPRAPRDVTRAVADGTATLPVKGGER